MRRAEESRGPDRRPDRTGAQEPPLAAATVFGPAFDVARRYANLLAGPGTVRGLIGPAEAPRIWDRHLLNSAAVAELLPVEGVLADLGSGAGLPGIVLALLRPAMRVVLVEPKLRRTDFLSECVAELGLRNVAVLRGRAEELAGQVEADVVTSRAVAPLSRLAVLARGLARPGGVLLAIKGAGAAAELEQALPLLRRLGLDDCELVRVGGEYLRPEGTVVRMKARRGAAAGEPDRKGRRAGRSEMAKRRQ